MAIYAQTSKFLRVAALAAAATVVAFLAFTPAAAAEYTLDIPGGGNSVPPPLTPPGTTTAPPTGTTGTTTGEVGTTNGKGKKKPKKDNGKKKERKLPELGPDKPGAAAAPVSAVARGTTPGLLPLAAVLVTLLIAAFTARRLARNKA